MIPILVKLVEGPIDEGEIRGWVGTPQAGAISLFLGTARDHHEGKEVLKLEYEAYAPMAEREMRGIAETIAARWPVERVALVHRVGVVLLGEASVLVAVSAAHRDAAFEACRFGIDRLKETVPIWKKEYYP